jgi:hypothetical protein
MVRVTVSLESKKGCGQCRGVERTKLLRNEQQGKLEHPRRQYIRTLRNHKRDYLKANKFQKYLSDSAIDLILKFHSLPAD